MSNTNSKLRWVYLIGFFIILALPLLNLPPWFSPPDWGKTIIFRIVLSVLIFLFIYQILFQKGWGKNSTIVGILHRGENKTFWPFWLLIALLGIYFLATVFSLDTRFSLLGNPYRSGGFVNFAFYIIFAILLFLILRKKDWQKIWVFAFIIGICVSVIAIFQQFGYFSKIFISTSVRPPSTAGGPIFLAIYLLLLSFPALSFAVNPGSSKVFWRWVKRIFYFASFVLFIFVAIFITQTRAVFLGLAIGLLYFLIFYPLKKKWLSLGLKIATLIILLLGIYGVYYINTQPEFPQFIQENKLLSRTISRLSVKEALENPRVSGWKVSWQALKNRPILGYGPENFNIGFDKYYDPSLPKIDKSPGGEVTSWWDRAHNFIFDIGITASIPALIIYLLLFGALFFQLQKLKNAEQNADNYAEKTPIIAHGIQATFIGYLVANFFSFDTFSTYLIFFLLIAYSLTLITQSQKSTIVEKTDWVKNNDKKRNQRRTVLRRFGRYKKTIISLSFVCLIWFVWAYNIKPFKINTQINIAKYLSNNGKCEQALARMENILPEKSFLDNYARLKYIDFLKKCEGLHPEKSFEYAKKGAELLKENIEIRPYYVRNWILLAGFNTILIDYEQNSQEKEKLIEETKQYFEKAEELSPKRQEVFIEWCKYGIVSDEYQIAKEKAQKCIEVNPKLADCYWFKGLAEISLGNLEEGKENIKIAKEKKYSAASLLSLNQLAGAHSIAENYQELVPIYQKIIKKKPEEPQYHATLAFIYKNLREFDKARVEAMKVLELQPENKDEVELFLKSLE